MKEEDTEEQDRRNGVAGVRLSDNAHAFGSKATRV